jgi:hypothetical protein
VPARRGTWSHALGGGALAGVAAGLVLSVIMLLMSIARGDDVWMGMKVPAAPFLGEAAMQPGFEAGPVLAGVASHFLVSIAWALPFALLVYGMSRAGTLWAGALWGVVVWIGMYYVVLPILGLGSLTEHAPAWLAILEHVLYGAVVAAAFLPFQRRAEHPSAPPEASPRSPTARA